MNLDTAYFTYLRQRAQWKPRLVILFQVLKNKEFFPFSYQTAATLSFGEIYSELGPPVPWVDR